MPSGQTLNMTMVYDDSYGADDISGAELLINDGTGWYLNPGGASPVNTCYVSWSDATNGFYLANDAGNSWLGPLTSGGLQNSQCTITGGSVSKSGSTLTASIVKPMGLYFL